jgi:hypothetical protein
VLGRVVIYRNGVAFYERHARVDQGRVTVRVPRDRVDDFLKSLTVVERRSRKTLSVTIPRREADDGSYLTMTLETPDLADGEVLLTYVTEAPSWKPSYRVVVGADGKVMLEGWAIVDNTTSEDWKQVQVGVGASSALAFRYDLWSVRQVDRDLLQGEDRFAIAPPTGVSPYEETAAEELAQLDATELRSGAKGHPIAAAGPPPTTQVSSTAGRVTGTVTDHKTNEKLAGVTVVLTGPALQGEQVVITDERGGYLVDGLPPGTYTATFYYGEAATSRAGVKVAAGKTTAVAQALKGGSSGGGEVITISGNTPIIDQGSMRTGTNIDKSDIRNVTQDLTRNIPTGRTFGGVLGSAAGSQSSENTYIVEGINTSSTGSATAPVRQGDAKLKAIVDKVLKDKRDVVVEVHAPPGGEQQAAERGAAVKNKLVNDGVPASRVRVVPRIGAGETEAVRVLAVAPSPQREGAAPPAASTRGPISDTPVGESHFIAERPMTVRAGTSAMVAMVHQATTGGVVYLYDPISDRGDERFAFKSVRLDNPTDDTLEPGPVTVYGDGRFIGEGITEPVPPRAPVVVPFALDKQIVVSRNASEQDRIAKLVTVQRGVITADVQHRRETRFTVTSRLAVPSTVYLRHRLATGWTLIDPPKFTKVGDSELFELRLGPAETKYLTIAEATPVQRTLELASPEALGMMKLYVDDPAASPQLKAQVAALLATHQGAGDLTDRIATLRDQLAEYRSRSGELHAQLVTLKAVKTGGELMASLRTRLSEMSDRVQKTTLEIVDAQEKLMLARVKFQNQLADLRLTDARSNTP